MDQALPLQGESFYSLGRRALALPFKVLAFRVKGLGFRV